MNKTKNTSNNIDDFNVNLDIDLDLDIDLSSDFDSKKEDGKEEDESPLENPQKELTEEIRSFRAKAKEFQATNDHETYLVVVFSTKEDRKEFLQNVNLSDEHTLIDGYELAKKLSLQPDKPKFKLKKPF